MWETTHRGEGAPEAVSPLASSRYQMSVDDEIDELAVRLERVIAQNEKTLDELEIVEYEEPTGTPAGVEDVDPEELFS